MAIYVGINGTPKEVTELYIGVNGVPKEANAVYFGINGMVKDTHTSVEPGETVFTSSTVFIVPKGVKEIECFVVGGGGSGYTNVQQGNGGGGGYTKTEKLLVSQGDIVNVIVGSGGEKFSNGSYSQIGSIKANGGCFINSSNGADGGSGGAAGWYMATDGFSVTTAYACKGGSDGEDGENSPTKNVYGVVHTNKGGTGQHTTTRAFEEPNGTLYAGGGGGTDGHTTGSKIGAGGAGGGGNGFSSGATNTGGGGGAHTGYGGSGIAIIRWGY